MRVCVSVFDGACECVSVCVRVRMRGRVCVTLYAYMYTSQSDDHQNHILRYVPLGPVGS